MAEQAADVGGTAPRVAIVGAGVAGLTCARALADRGWRVRVFERGSSIGGRLASLQTDSGSFDVGAQYLTVQSEPFADEVRRWAGADLVRSWEAALADLSNGQGSLIGPSTTRYVGIPTMQSLAVFLARGLDIRVDSDVSRLAHGLEPGALAGVRAWTLFDAQDRPLGGVADGAGGFDALVLAVPSVDALALVRGHCDFVPQLESVRWDACWSAALSLLRPSSIEFDGAFINDDPILAWAARETSKPMRDAVEGVPERWLLQARPSWSNNFVELGHDEAARWMQRAFAARLARPLAQKSCSALRWRVATAATPLTVPCLWDADRRLGLAGNWCGGARIESAYLSGMALARAIAP